MRILLSNDDGIFSPGLAAMARVMRRFGEVCVAAPATEQSGVGPSITFLSPLTVKKVYRKSELWGYAVEGTPVDCVKIGVEKLMTERPDVVVSGINNGLNVGINVFYSGTVAAALEGAWQGITSFAVSTQYTDLRQGDQVERAAEVAGEIIARLLKQSKNRGDLFNINIPFDALKPGADRSAAVVPMDMTPHWSEFEERHDPTNRRYYWLSGRPNPACGPATETDMGVVASGRIAVTPLSIDMTHYSMIGKMKDWDLGPTDDFTFPSDVETESPDFQLFRWIDRL